jgi:membrane protease YdiL (CAAX protease family)
MSARPFSASGLQITLLVFALVFLAAPAAKHLGPHVPFAEEIPASLGQAFIFGAAVVLLIAIPGVRAFCSAHLRRPIAPCDRLEVGIVVASNAFVPFAIFGGIVLWHWICGGEMGLARWVGSRDTSAAAMEHALSLDGRVHLFLAVIVGPIVEELVFRGMLFRSWEAEWGWFPAMLATSAVFAAYHPVPFAAFIVSVILVTLYRRTGSLRACVLVHAVYNALLWYPLMGRHYLHTAGKETGEVELWTWHLVALALLAIALPVYVWTARDRDTGTEETAERIAVAQS